jgi:hypothetical protein
MSVRHIATIASLTLAAAAFVSLSPIAAQAAPQVLGVVASNDTPTPLNCGTVDCSAHLSAFCLQQSRPAPSHGYVYGVAPGGTMTLIATAADGRTLRLPADHYVRFESVIGFTSVRASLPKAALDEIGAVSVALEVGPLTSLLPIPIAGDMDPQVEDEVALATGPMRQAATRNFEEPGIASDAARITSLLINALPEKGPESVDQRDGLWVAMADSTAVTNATVAGLAKAEMLYNGCRLSVESRSTYSMRNCLELRHADLLAEANHRFWQETGGY